MQARAARGMMLGARLAVLLAAAAGARAAGGLELIEECDSTDVLFDTSGFLCGGCEDPLVAGAGGTDCVCPSGFQEEPVTLFDEDSADSLNAKVCVQCAANEAPTQDGLACIPCQNGTLPLAGLCPFSCGAGEIFVETDSAGAYLAVRTCQACPSGARVDDYTCLECPDSDQVAVSGTCTCQTGILSTDGVTCLPEEQLDDLEAAFPADLASQVSFPRLNGGAGRTVTSDTFVELFQTNAVRCRVFLDITACQIIANLCVLQVYNPETTACQLFVDEMAIRTIVNSDVADQQWREGLPWLTYENDDADVILGDKGLVEQEFTFDHVGRLLASRSSMDFLDLRVAVYTLRGEFLGFETAAAQIQQCNTNTPNAFRRFGRTYELSCAFDITGFFDADAAEPLFYDLYLFDSDETLKPVPVRIRDYQDDNGDAVNRDGSIGNDQLTRRFYVVDNVSGRTDGETVAIRYAKTMKLVVQLLDETSGRIFVPVLNIEYDEADSSVLSVETGSLSVGEVSAATPRVQFQTQYEMNLGDHFAWNTILFIVLVILLFLTWIFSLAMYMRRTHNNVIDGSLLGYAVVAAFRHGATMCGFLVFLNAFYFFITFKGQSAPSVFLPDKQDRHTFETLLILTFCGKTLHLLYTIRAQINSDIFVIDWEKSRGKLQGKGGQSGGQAPVSVWRSFFVANEYSELQTERMLSFEFNLFVVLLFLVGFDYQYLATPQPDSTDLTPGPTDPLLRVAVAISFWLVPATGQYLWVVLVRNRFFGHPLHMFIDLLSVTNTSLFLLSNTGFHGYYIHGRSVHSYADTNMLEMAEMLKREEENLVGKRGLLPDSDMQTFEMYITDTLRDKYKSIFLYLLAQDASDVQKSKGGAGPKRGPGMQDIKIVKAQATLNRFLGRFVEQKGITQQGLEYVVRKKSYLQNALGLSPDYESMVTNLFFEDPQMNFSALFWYGIEDQLLTYNITLFCLVYYVTGEPFAAAIATYLVQKLLDTIRSSQGHKNLAKKTLVDERFLL